FRHVLLPEASGTRSRFRGPQPDQRYWWLWHRHGRGGDWTTQVSCAALDVSQRLWWCAFIQKRLVDSRLRITYPGNTHGKSAKVCDPSGSVSGATPQSGIRSLSRTGDIPAVPNRSPANDKLRRQICPRKHGLFCVER